MHFIVSEIKTDDFILEKVIEELESLLFEFEGFCFIRFPISGMSRTIENPDMLFISKDFGIIIVDVFDFTIENIDKIENTKWYFINYYWEYKEVFEEGEDKVYAICSRMSVNRNLRKYSATDDRLRAKYFVYLPNLSRRVWERKFGGTISEKIIFQDGLAKLFEEQKADFKYQSKIPNDIWTELIALFSGSTVLSKPLRKQESEKTKAWIIRKVESKRSKLDLLQIKVGQQIPQGVQRIRGLAGTGKTIVLAMKAAHMHLQHPEWDIVYTFNTQSLYNYSYDLIKRFHQAWSDGLEPDWDKLRILHGWGGKSREGLYSYVSKSLGKDPKTFSEAKDFFEFKQGRELLGKCCLDLMDNDNIPPLFDAILIDEAQDFHNGFLRFCYEILKPPKRLIFAYDELQSLEDVSIPTSKDIFGVDKNGIPRVDLDGIYAGGIEKDSILYCSYRNPSSVLITAHMFGMGLFRSEGPIQFIPNPEAWGDVGYEIVDGTFKIGEMVTVTRPKKYNPQTIEDFVNPNELMKIKVFQEKKEELEWIANEISNDIYTEKLQPEDILVIGLDNKNLFYNFTILKGFLQQRGIKSFVIGKDKRDKSIFRTPNYVSLSTVFKAKGNESPSVYIFSFENSEKKTEIIQARNVAFTSITRTKGWCTITGTGEKMIELEKELHRIIKDYPNVQFKIPDLSKIKRYLDNIEYEKRRLRIAKSEKAIMAAIEKITGVKGEEELSPLAKAKIIELARKIEKKD